MDTTEQEIAEPAPAAPSGPGMRLREAREAAGLTREEVAIRLRLKLELIRALEEDDYERLPSSAFVSGYLRSYARLLDLPAEEVIATFVPPTAEPPLVSPVMPPRQRRSGDLPVKVVTYLIALLLVVLAMVWWAARRPATPPNNNQAPTVLKHGGTVELQLPPPASSDSTAANPPSSPATPNAQPAAPTTMTPAAAPAPNTAAAAQPPAAAAPAEAALQLEAKADCWVEITDATGQRLVFDLLKAGTSRTVRGKAPFDVFLGYAPGMTVYYQGKVFDQSHFQHGEKAHFHVGKASDNAPLTE